jgi:hypothetical protein
MPGNRHHLSSGFTLRGDAASARSGDHAPLPMATPNAAGWMLAGAPAHALADYYLAALGTRPVPSRGAFDPSAIKSLLPRIYLLELRRLPGARPMPFLRGGETVTTLPL